MESLRGIVHFLDLCPSLAPGIYHCLLYLRVLVTCQRLFPCHWCFAFICVGTGYHWRQITSRGERLVRVTKFCPNAKVVPCMASSKLDHSRCNACRFTQCSFGNPVQPLHLYRVGGRCVSRCVCACMHGGISGAFSLGGAEGSSRVLQEVAEIIFRCKSSGTRADC
jgi:hypothetical protein